MFQFILGLCLGLMALAVYYRKVQKDNRKFMDVVVRETFAYKQQLEESRMENIKLKYNLRKIQTIVRDEINPKTSKILKMQEEFKATMQPEFRVN